MTPRLRPAALALVTALSAALVVTSGAPAADAATKHQRLRVIWSIAMWERVAACESSHQWHINTHNGYYGGIQFLQATWLGFGGKQYAPRADLATRSQQIAVARRVLAAQGPTAWPVCGKRAHLTRARGLATSTALPAIGPVVRATSHPKPTHHKPKPAHHKPKPAHHKPKPAHHKAKPAHHKARPKPTKHKVAKHAVRRHHTVLRDETLSTIAENFHVQLGALWRLNRNLLHYTNVIVVGQKLRIPRT